MDRTSMMLAINGVYWFYVATHWADWWAMVVRVLEVLNG